MVVAAVDGAAATSAGAGRAAAAGGTSRAEGNPPGFQGGGAGKDLAATASAASTASWPAVGVRGIARRWRRRSSSAADGVFGALPSAPSQRLHHSLCIAVGVFITAAADGGVVSSAAAAAAVAHGAPRTMSAAKETERPTAGGAADGWRRQRSFCRAWTASRSSAALANARPETTPICSASRCSSLSCWVPRPDLAATSRVAAAAAAAVAACTDVGASRSAASADLRSCSSRRTDAVAPGVRPGDGATVSLRRARDGVDGSDCHGHDGCEESGGCVGAWMVTDFFFVSAAFGGARPLVARSARRAACFSSRVGGGALSGSHHAVQLSAEKKESIFAARARRRSLKWTEKSSASRSSDLLHFLRERA